MRLPYVLPTRIIAPVVIMLSTIFVAVPAFIRVDPVMTSGPVIGTLATWTRRNTSGGGGVQAQALGRLGAGVCLPCRRPPFHRLARSGAHGVRLSRGGDSYA